MRYEVTLAPAAARQLRKVDPHVRRRVQAAIEPLPEQPRPPAATRQAGGPGDGRARILAWAGTCRGCGPLKNARGVACWCGAYPAGEAVGTDRFSFYRSLGMNLKQLYGQTEAFLYLTAQPDGQIYSDTVGPALPNVDLRIADNGEVQFKSPGMFVSYFKDDAKTRETMTPDGYVKTGDAGFFDSETGHLKIIDRAKDVGKLKDGTLFPPKYIENKL